MYLLIRILRCAKYKIICHIKEKINHSWRHQNCNWSAESFKYTIAASTFLYVVQSFKHLLFKNIFEISFWVVICTTYIDMFGNFSHSNLFHVSLHFINFSFQNIVKDLCSSSEGGANSYYLLCAKSNPNAVSLNVTNFLLAWFQVKLNSSEVIQDTKSIDAFLDYLGE